MEKRKLFEECISIENKLQQLKDRYGNLEKEYKDTLLELETLSVESDSKTNLGKESETLQKLFSPKPSASLVVNMEGNSSPHFSPSSTINSDVQPSDVQSEEEKKPLAVLHLSFSSGKQSVGEDGELVVNACQADTESKEFEAQNQNQGKHESFDSSLDSTRFPIEVEERSNAEPLGLINEPSSSVSSHVYNVYRLLLITISDRLPNSDIIKLKEWADEKFSVDTDLSAEKVILQLDQKSAINILDLSPLRAFLESISRYDLVYLIDEFYNGDYAKLKQLIKQHESRNNIYERVTNLNRVHSSGVLLPLNKTQGSSLKPNPVNRDINIVQELQRPSTADKNNGVFIARNRQCTDSVRLNSTSTSNTIVSCNRFSTHENSEDIPDDPAVKNTRGNPSDENRMSLTDTPVTTRKINGMEMPNARQPSSQNHDAQNDAASSQCHGTFQCQPDDQFEGSGNGDEDNWLCNHYKRRCLVKFECCNKYWPCHRCHNSESSCGRTKLKSRDTTMLKCVECGKEQQFGKNGQFCVSCNTKFANFYCGLCKHLTGNDDYPYHCDKCGICRIHGDRSFHCDVCGVCLDVQLRGNHKCRPDSAHDECCICSEDAFTGCQILPCSHKVHKECAIQMIRSGITRCPTCHESFAHKLVRRQTGTKTAKKS
ncbi:RING finger and CHY zinc finger domain-containing 1-like [Paramuricea clavata]|nr:RING finger and CHY zinc finger domain-containing 1-like [Paramuricea clavata]